MLFQHKATVCCDKAEWNFNSTFVPSLAQFCDTKNAREKSVLYETTMAVVLFLRQNTMDAVYGWLKEATSRTKELLNGVSIEQVNKKLYPVLYYDTCVPPWTISEIALSGFFQTGK